jgi:hypothetical protein
MEMQATAKHERSAYTGHLFLESEGEREAWHLAAPGEADDNPAVQRPVLPLGDGKRGDELQEGVRVGRLGALDAPLLLGGLLPVPGQAPRAVARGPRHERARGADVRVRVGERGHGGLEDEHAGPGQVGGVPDLAAVDGEDVGDGVHDELGRIHAELERRRHLGPQRVRLLAAGHHEAQERGGVHPRAQRAQALGEALGVGVGGGGGLGGSGGGGGGGGGDGGEVVERARDGGVDGGLPAVERVERAVGARVEGPAADAERVGARREPPLERAEVVGQLLVEARAGGQQLLLALELCEAGADHVPRDRCLLRVLLLLLGGRRWRRRRSCSWRGHAGGPPAETLGAALFSPPASSLTLLDPRNPSRNPLLVVRPRGEGAGRRRGWNGMRGGGKRGEGGVGVNKEVGGWWVGAAGRQAAGNCKVTAGRSGSGGSPVLRVRGD